MLSLRLVVNGRKPAILVAFSRHLGISIGPGGHSIFIPSRKSDGSKRPLGIPTIRDRVAQMAAKLVIEPIFEADFCDSSYVFRPKKSAHDAVDDVAYAMNTGNR